MYLCLFLLLGLMVGKIGILTLPLRRNYGGILQAYALKVVLKRLGHDSILITRPKDVWELRMKKEYAIMAQFVKPFIDKHLPQIVVKSVFHLNISKFNAIIVGSDQVWRSRYARNIMNMFLDFVPKDSKCRKVAYAASFGISKWNFSPKQTTRIAALAKQFNAISVREDSGVALCRKYLGVNALHVLDPTMLLTAQDYIQLLQIGRILPSKGQLLVYLLDMRSDKKKVVDIMASNKNYTPFFVNSQSENIHLPTKKRISLPLEQWLRGFLDTKLVFTDSFHGCVFSIIFNKPFIVYGNELRGMARFNSLLKTFGLENQYILSSEELKEQLENDINWEKVNERMEELKNLSKAFLVSALGF